MLKFIVYPYLWKYRILKKAKISIRKNSSDINVLYHILIEKEYKIPFFIDNPKVIIDAGANIGLTSFYFAIKYPNAKVFAIEPESSNFDFLLKNAKNYKNIIPLQYGIWSKDRKLVVENPKGENWSFMTKQVENMSQYDIDGISVKTLMSNYNIETIDIFKIDIEGAEEELFSKNEKFWLEKTKCIVLEIHNKKCRSAVENAMQKYGFVLISISGENEYYKNTRLVK